MTTDAQRLAAITTLRAELDAIRKRRSQADYGHRSWEAGVRLRELLATPPTGYVLPEDAAALVDHARAHGWDVCTEWMYGTADPVQVVIQAERRVEQTREYLTNLPGGRRLHGFRWRFRLVWSGHGLPTGQMQLYGRGAAEFPDRFDGPKAAPPLESIRAVITANPCPAESER